MTHSTLSLRSLSLSLLFLIVSSSVYGQESPLVSYWALDDETGQTVVADDLSISDGSLNGNASLEELGVNAGGTSVAFDGSGDYIEIPHVEDYLLDEGTIVFWFNAESVGSRRGLWSKDSTSYDTGGHLTIFLESDGRVSARLQSTSTSYQIYSTLRASEDTWHHIAFIFGSDGMELFMDGESQGTNSYEGGLGESSGGAGNKEPIVLGGNSWQSNNLSATPVKNYFDGLIDEVGLIGERWSSSTMLDLYQQTGPGGSISLASFAEPQVFYVRTRGLDSNDGLSAQTSFKTIGKAVSMCTRASATVYVGPGEYDESLEIGLGDGSDAVSGYADAPTRLIADVSGEHTLDDPGAVILDGNGARTTAIELSGVDHWSIEGWTISGFTQYGIFGSDSGFSVIDCEIGVPTYFGIYATVDADFTVRGCRFVRTASSRHVCWVQPASEATGMRIEFSNNDATLRDELYLSSSMSSQSNWWDSWYDYYRSLTYGLIVYGYQGGFGEIEVSNNQISDSYLPIYVYASNASDDVRIVNNTIVGSLYSIYCYISGGDSEIMVHNNIIDQSYYGLLAYASSGPTLSVAGLLENDLAYTMSGYGRGFEFSVIEGDPQFVDPEKGDFSLFETSPAVDAGTTNGAPGTDINGVSRPLDGNDDGIAQVDLGAYEQVQEGGQRQVRVIQWREVGGDDNR